MKTYYTKCGREFKKSINADVTGYKMDEGDQECAKCPFKKEVTKGWPAVFDHWECRAGSEKPNKNNEWVGSIEDKNSIHIKSLNHEFLESILAYCKEQPDLSAGYTQDTADCRRAISVSCSSNKKGIAAKKALVEKFFGHTQEVQEYTERCETCAYGIDYGESVEYIKCQEGKKDKDVKKNQLACVNYISEIAWDSERDDEPDGDLEDQLEQLLEDGDKADSEESKDCETSISEKRNPRITHGACKEMREDCPCFCKHNDGCSVLLVKGKAIKDNIEYFNKYNIDCDVYRKVAERVNDTPENENETNDIVTKETKNVNDIAEIDTKTSEIVTFDYSTVDEETAEFLQERANKITFINASTSYAVGKELKEAQEKLSNHDKTKGVFQKWCRSLGISEDTAYNYIHVFSFVTERFGNIEDAKDFLSLSQKLQYAVSKPSSSPELQQAVLDGDITTHKQYKEKEAEWKEKLEQYRSQQDILRTEKQQASINAMDAERRADRLETEAEELREQLEELQEQNNESQNNEELSKLQNRIKELEDMLKDKPIETSAIQIVEKVPEKNAIETKNRLYGLLLAVNQITKQDIQIVCDTDDHVKKMAIAEFLENIRDNAPGYINMLYGVELE